MGWAFGMVIAWKLVTYVPTYNIGCQYHILNFSGLLYQLGAKHNTVRFAVWPVGADIKLHCGHKVWCSQKHSYWYTASKCLALHCLQLADRQGDKFANTVTHSDHWELQMIWMLWHQTTAVTVLRIFCGEYMYVEITVVSFQMYWNKNNDNNWWVLLMPASIFKIPSSRVSGAEMNEAQRQWILCQYPTYVLLYD